MSRRPRAVALLVAIVAAGLSFPAALASIARTLDLPQLAASAERIVVADVVSVESAWDAAHRNIHTTVELAVRESWKGDIPGSGRLALRQLGGTVGEIEMSVLGAAKFVPGERALFFLGRQGLVGRAVASESTYPVRSGVFSAATAVGMRRCGTTPYPLFPSPFFIRPCCAAYNALLPARGSAGPPRASA